MDKAYEVTISGWPPFLYVAKSASKARYKAKRAYEEARGRKLKFWDIRVIRSPEADNLIKSYDGVLSFDYHVKEAKNVQ